MKSTADGRHLSPFLICPSFVCKRDALTIVSCVQHVQCACARTPSSISTCTSPTTLLLLLLLLCRYRERVSYRALFICARYLSTCRKRSYHPIRLASLRFDCHKRIHSSLADHVSQSYSSRPESRIGLIETPKSLCRTRVIATECRCCSRPIQFNALITFLCNLIKSPPFALPCGG